MLGHHLLRVSGLDAVELRLKNRDIRRISTDDPQGPFGPECLMAGAIAGVWQGQTAREDDMLTYVVLAKFTDQGIRNAKESPKRAEAFKQMAETFGVTVKELFWTQGRYDIVTVVDAPDEFSATALNLSLSALGNIRTESLRAFSAADMATIVSKMI
jgi:uncharacterized protein with GYD domain